MATPTPAQIEEIAERAAIKAVHSILVTLGVDTSKPLEAQRDFQTLRELTRLAADTEFRKDLEHMRTWRKRTETLTTRGWVAAMTTAVGGLMIALWHGLQVVLQVPKPPH